METSVKEEELLLFLRSKSLASKLADNAVQSEILAEKEGYEGFWRWDTFARDKIGKRMKAWFEDAFGDRTLGDKWEKCFGYEGGDGLNRKLQRRVIFGCCSYPDMFFLKPTRVAIELDHGTHGSQVKNALTKAGFDKLSSDWDHVFVFFFDESPDKKVKESLETEYSNKVLDFYRQNLNTEIIVL